MGRFLAADPLGHGSDMSLYGYANGDPVNYIDPTGRAGYFIDGTHYSELGQNGSHDGSNNVYLLSQNY
ncbi:MAG: hypothetical protein NZM04_11135, partial [Methylacidiphilales bacterium]|nr:hypothetical protein [Candidatus Methylacidiphilales bacterium]